MIKLSISKFSLENNKFYTFITQQFVKKKYELILCSRMDSMKILAPPLGVRGMKVLEKEAFTKTLSIPSIEVNVKDLNKVSTPLKKYFLKLRNFDSIIKKSDDNSMRELLLDPDLGKEIVLTDTFKTLNVEMQLRTTDIVVKYDNWNAQQILDSVLPPDVDKTSSFSQIGHIMHLNLREHLLPYKYLIGEVYLSKNRNVKLVVNKINIIDDSDNTFRTFLMEKLAGDNDDTGTEVSVSENGCTFVFDFAKVYWNPRLSTEHERIVKKLNKYDILYDVMAGVGPFAIPAAKKKCTVLANDLNPYSYESLKQNSKRNKACEYINCFNIDGNVFIKTVLKEHLEAILSDTSNHRSIHITMNLPSIAIDFLPSFIGLYDNSFPKLIKDELNDMLPYLPLVHIYLFSFIELKEHAMYLVAEKLGFAVKVLETDKDKSSLTASYLKDCIDSLFLEHIMETINVRKVSNSKIMYRVSFYLPQEVLIKQKFCSDNPLKKIKLS